VERTLSLCEPWLKAWPKSTVLKRAGAQALVLGLQGGLKRRAPGPPASRPALLRVGDHQLGDRRPEDYLFLARYHTWDGDRKGTLDVLADAKHAFPESHEILTSRDGARARGNLDLALEAAEEAARVRRTGRDLARAREPERCARRANAAAEALQRAITRTRRSPPSAAGDG